MREAVSGCLVQVAGCPHRHESPPDEIGMVRGALDLPGPGLAVRSIVDDEMLVRILAAYRSIIRVTARPRTKLDQHGVGRWLVADWSSVHGEKLRSKMTLWTARAVEKAAVPEAS
jgi:hypothetical protein